MILFVLLQLLGNYLYYDVADGRAPWLPRADSGMGHVRHCSTQGASQALVLSERCRSSDGETWEFGACGEKE